MDDFVIYQSLQNGLPNFTEVELRDNIYTFQSNITQNQFFSLCQECSKHYRHLFPTFYFTLMNLYREENVSTFIYKYQSYFEWYDYIYLLRYLTSKYLDIHEVPVYCNIFTSIIDFLADNLFTERYYKYTVSSLGWVLPREKKNLDRRTKIVRKLAYAYYKIYTQRNHMDTDWEDIGNIINIRNKALQLYRKDVANVTQRYKVQLDSRV